MTPRIGSLNWTRRCTGALTWLPGLLVCIGCGDGMYDLRAKVTLDGKPLEGAVVTLMSTGTERTRPSSGFSDAEGNVRFTTMSQDDGVRPGSYKVVVIKVPKNAAAELATYDPKNPADMKKIMARERTGNVDFTPTLLPQAYLTAETSPLTCEVPPKNEGEVVFALDSSLGKRKK